MNKGKKILIVDDNEVILKTLSLKLTSAGYAVLTAIDGSAAVAAARRDKPDLILLDLSFPPDVAHGGGVPWDGFLIINWLRRIDEASRFLPLDQLAISPQCGFASDIVGNPLSEDDQWRKLELVELVARDVWGT